MPHPDEGLLHAWLDGELDAAEAARVEALVASDPEWAVAAMEARGLLAASARIVAALDHVPANVIPQPATSRRTASRWMWRVAAVVALMAGSAVVLERGTPDFTAPAPAKPPAAATLRPPPGVVAGRHRPRRTHRRPISKVLFITKNLIFQSNPIHCTAGSRRPRPCAANAAAACRRRSGDAGRACPPGRRRAGRRRDGGADPSLCKDHEAAVVLFPPARAARLRHPRDPARRGRARRQHPPRATHAAR